MMQSLLVLPALPTTAAKPELETCTKPYKTVKSPHTGANKVIGLAELCYKKLTKIRIIIYVR